ncbi:MAG: hypothetical protein J1F67_09400 [Muribaculaceae bacterium]|nr:hypothetical protein [Muribaculaceae bacterium]
MPQSTDLLKVDAKHGEERIFTDKQRVHIEPHRMPKSAGVIKDGCQEALSEEILSEL